MRLEGVKLWVVKSLNSHTNPAFISIELVAINKPIATSITNFHILKKLKADNFIISLEHHTITTACYDQGKG